MDSRTQVKDLTKGTERIIQLLEEAKQISFSQLPSNETQCQGKQAIEGLSKYAEHFSRPRQRRNKYGEQRSRSHGYKPDNLRRKPFQRQSRSCPNLLLQEEVEASRIKQLIGKEEFANWTKCVLALNQVRHASADVLEYKFRMLTAKFNEDHLALFLTCLNKNEIKHLKQNHKGGRVRKKREWKCEHNACRTILEELLQTYCIDQTNEWTIELTKPENPSKTQTSKSSDAEADKNDWYWLIGRLFSDSEIYDSAYRDLGKLDISQIIKVHRNCRLFEFDGSADVYDKILSKRNELTHSSENMVSKGYLDETFAILYKLLLQFSTEVHICKSSYDELRKLKEETLVVSLIRQSDDPVEQALKCTKEAVKSDLYFSDEKQKDQLMKLLSTTSEQLTSLQVEKEKRKAMEEDFKMLRSGADESECLEFRRRNRDAMASAKQPDAKRKEAYYMRTHFLVVNLGTATLRAYFDRKVPPQTLNIVLNNNIRIINAGKAKGYVKQHHHRRLFPTSGPPNSQDFDIFLLCFFLRNICGLNAKSRWWLEEDNSTIPDGEHSVEADIVRIRNMKNTLENRSDCSLEENEFQMYWDTMEKAMCRLAAQCNFREIKEKIEELKRSDWM